MLTSPQSVTINTVATDLHKTRELETSSIYESTDATLSLKVSHQQAGTRMRRMVRVDKKIIAADPLTALSQYQTAGIYIVIDEPSFGFGANDIENIVNGLKAWLTTANIQAVLANRH